MRNYANEYYPQSGFIRKRSYPDQTSNTLEIQLRRTSDNKRSRIVATDPTGDRVMTIPDRSITVNDSADLSGTSLPASIVTSSLTSLGPQSENLDMNANQIDNCDQLNVNDTTTTILSKSNSGFQSTLMTDTLTESRNIWFPNKSITINSAPDLHGTTLASEVVDSNLQNLGVQDSDLDMNGRNIDNVAAFSNIGDMDFNPSGILGFNSGVRYIQRALIEGNNNFATDTDMWITLDQTGHTGYTNYFLPTPATNPGRQILFQVLSPVTQQILLAGTIDGVTNYPVQTDYESLLLVCDGVGWKTLFGTGNAKRGIVQTCTLGSTTVHAHGKYVQHDLVVRNAFANVYLPALATSKGKSYTVVRTTANPDPNQITTVFASTGSLINGLGSYVMTGEYESATFFCNGTSWTII